MSLNYIFQNTCSKNFILIFFNTRLINNTTILVRASQQYNNNFYFKCKKYKECREYFKCLGARPNSNFWLNTEKTMPLMTLQCHSQCNHSMSTVWFTVQWVYIHSEVKKKIKINWFFLKSFLKRKNKHALIRKFNSTSNEKNIIIQLLYNIKKLHQFIFSL